MKVSELTGAKLDYWVAKANLKEGEELLGTWNYSPSTDWSQGGPIIDRERIMLEPIETWVAHLYVGGPKDYILYEGKTPLIAAMRCFVASRFGEEVPDE